MKRSLHWFRNDLRLRDNAALRHAATAGEPADSARRAELLTSIGVDPAAPGARVELA